MSKLGRKITVSKSIRIPLELNDKIDDFTENNEMENSTQSIICLLKLGLLFEEKFHEVEDSPEILKEIEEKREKIISQYTENQYIHQFVERISKSELDKVFVECFLEIFRRIGEEESEMKVFGFDLAKKAIDGGLRRQISSYVR